MIKTDYQLRQEKIIESALFNLRDGNYIKQKTILEIVKILNKGYK